jgi:hypothetical protein
VATRSGAALNAGRRARRLEGLELEDRLVQGCPEAARAVWRRPPEKGLREPSAGVREVGLAADENGYWLWAAPRDAPTASPPQIALDIPAGRFRLDFYDTGENAWIAHESAASSPLIVALPFRGAPLVVRILALDSGDREEGRVADTIAARGGGARARR